MGGHHDPDFDVEVAGRAVRVGMPYPRTRNRRPRRDPAGRSTRVVPVGVGTGIDAPGAASQGATGTCTMMSRPSTCYSGWGASRTTRYRSPGGAPPLPAPP